MANDITQLVDVITPELYNAYMQQYTAEKSSFVQSGIAVSDTRVAQQINNGGILLNMPFWNDLTGDDEVLDDGDTALGTDKITAGMDISTVMYRGKAWKVNELAAVISGDDPMKALLSRIGDFWLRREQKVLIAVLNGLFGTKTIEETEYKGTLVDSHLLDISGNSGAAGKLIGGTSILDTKQLLGDAADKVKSLAMHSAVYTALQKQQLIEYIPDASNSNIKIPYYLGYRVAAVDDSIPVEGTGANAIYTTYLFANGSIARNEGNPNNLTTYETDREKLKGNDIVITRRALTMHPYGVKFTSADVKDITPSNEELSDPRNWSRVYEKKNIGLLALKHKI